MNHPVTKIYKQINTNCLISLIYLGRYLTALKRTAGDQTGFEINREGLQFLTLEPQTKQVSGVSP